MTVVKSIAILVHIRAMGEPQEVDNFLEDRLTQITRHARAKPRQRTRLGKSQQGVVVVQADVTHNATTHYHLRS